MDKVWFTRVPCQLWLLNDSGGLDLLSLDIAEFARVSRQRLHTSERQKSSGVLPTDIVEFARMPCQL